MSYDESAAALSRTVIQLAVLKLDYCARTHDVSPCAASGTPACYYTYPTCQDPAHYSRASRDYVFSSADGPLVEGALPLLLEVKGAPTEIRPEDNVTRRARVTLDFIDDAPLALANPDKSVSNEESAGTFFRNLLGRNPNLRGRIAEVWQGFAGLDPADYRLTFRGVIEAAEVKKGRARFIVKDQLKLLEVKIPPAQSSGNSLTSVYNGGSTMDVTKGAEFEAPGTVKIEDEYVDFAGVAGDTLTGCVAGRYGSAQASNPKGARVKQVSAFAEPETGAGLPADEIFLRLLCDYGGIDPLMISTVDRGVILSSGIAADAETIAVDHPEQLPETGVARIGDELVRWRGVTGPDLTVAERGAFGTTAAAHDAGDPFLPTRFSDELGRWMAGALYKRIVETPTPVKDLVNQLREQCLVHVWQDEDSAIRAKSIAPPFYTDAPKQIDDETGIVLGSTLFEPGLGLQFTRVAVYYAPTKPGAGEDPESFTGLLILADADAESANYFGEVRPQEIFADWIYREHEAILLASRFLIRYARGAATLRFALELKDGALQVGDFVKVTSNDVIGPDGAPIAGALFEVLSKNRVSAGRIEYTAIDTRLGRRYPVIAPASLTADYGSADEEQRSKYGWAGDADNHVGAPAEDGYYLY